MAQIKWNSSELLGWKSETPPSISSRKRKWGLGREEGKGGRFRGGAIMPTCWKGLVLPTRKSFVWNPNPCWLYHKLQPAVGFHSTVGSSKLQIRDTGLPSSHDESKKKKKVKKNSIKYINTRRNVKSVHHGNQDASYLKDFSAVSLKLWLKVSGVFWFFWVFFFALACVR